MDGLLGALNVRNFFRRAKKEVREAEPSSEAATASEHAAGKEDALEREAHTVVVECGCGRDSCGCLDGECRVQSPTSELVWVNEGVAVEGDADDDNDEDEEWEEEGEEEEGESTEDEEEWVISLSDDDDDGTEEDEVVTITGAESTQGAGGGRDVLKSSLPSSGFQSGAWAGIPDTSWCEDRSRAGVGEFKCRRMACMALGQCEASCRLVRRARYRPLDSVCCLCGGGPQRMMHDWLGVQRDVEEKEVHEGQRRKRKGAEAEAPEVVGKNWSGWFYTHEKSELVVFLVSDLLQATWNLEDISQLRFHQECLRYACAVNHADPMRPHADQAPNHVWRGPGGAAVSLDSDRVFKFVLPIYTASRLRVCFVCGKPGASVGCAGNCSRWFHLHCGLHMRCEEATEGSGVRREQMVIDEKSFRIRCSEACCENKPQLEAARRLYVGAMPVEYVGKEVKPWPEISEIMETEAAARRKEIEAMELVEEAPVPTAEDTEKAKRRSVALQVHALRLGLLKAALLSGQHLAQWIHEDPDIVDDLNGRISSLCDIDLRVQGTSTTTPLLEMHQRNDRRLKNLLNTLAGPGATFRPGQREAVESGLRGECCLLSWPTAAGKSLTFQLPALLVPGVTIVFEPTRRLIMNQVRALNEKFPGRGARNPVALALLGRQRTGDENNEEWDMDITEHTRLQEQVRTIDDDLFFEYVQNAMAARDRGKAALNNWVAERGGLLLYLAPEKLFTGSPAFERQIMELWNMGLIQRVVVDEAQNLIESAGLGRSAYQDIRRLRLELMPGVPITAVTAKTMFAKGMRQLLEGLGMSAESRTLLTLRVKNFMTDVQSTDAQDDPDVPMGLEGNIDVTESDMRELMKSDGWHYDLKSKLAKGLSICVLRPGMSQGRPGENKMMANLNELCVALVKDNLLTMQPGAPQHAPRVPAMGIVFCTTKRQVREVTQALNDHPALRAKKNHMPVAAMHTSSYRKEGGLDAKLEADHEASYEAWMSGELPILVCTSKSFGQGIDSGAVWVAHWGLPFPSLLDYAQEVGRIGRRGSASSSANLAEGAAPSPTCYAYLLYDLVDDILTVTKVLGSATRGTPGTLVLAHDVSASMARVAAFAHFDRCRMRTCLAEESGRLLNLSWDEDDGGQDCGMCDVCRGAGSTFDLWYASKDAYNLIRAIEKMNRNGVNVQQTNLEKIIRGHSIEGDAVAGADGWRSSQLELYRSTQKAESLFSGMKERKHCSDLLHTLLVALWIRGFVFPAAHQVGQDRRGWVGWVCSGLVPVSSEELAHKLEGFRVPIRREHVAAQIYCIDCGRCDDVDLSMCAGFVHMHESYAEMVKCLEGRVICADCRENYKALQKDDQVNFQCRQCGAREKATKKKAREPAEAEFGRLRSVNGKEKFSRRPSVHEMSPKDVVHDPAVVREERALKAVHEYLSLGDNDGETLYNWELENRVLIAPPIFRTRGSYARWTGPCPIEAVPVESVWRSGWVTRHPDFKGLKNRIIAGEVFDVLGEERSKRLRNSIRGGFDEETGLKLRTLGGQKLRIPQARDAVLALGLTEVHLIDLVMPLAKEDEPNDLQWYVFQYADAGDTECEQIVDPDATDSDSPDEGYPNGGDSSRRKIKYSDPSTPRYVCCVHWSLKRSIGCVWSLSSFYSLRGLAGHKELCKELARIHSEQGWLSSMEERQLQARARNEGMLLDMQINSADFETDKSTQVHQADNVPKHTESDQPGEEDNVEDTIWFPGATLSPELTAALGKLGWRSWWLVEQAISCACDKELVNMASPWDRLPASLFEELVGQRPSTVYRRVRAALSLASWELGDERRVKSLQLSSFANKSTMGLLDSVIEDMDDDDSTLRYIVHLVPRTKGGKTGLPFDRRPSQLCAVLEGPFREGEDGRSCTAARALPGERFLHVHVEKTLKNERHVRNLFKNGLFLGGRSWRAIYGKPVEGKLIMLAEEGVGLEGRAISTPEFRNRFIPYQQYTPPTGLGDFVEIAHEQAIEFNRKLKLSKFSSRFDMLFSSTLKGPACGDGTEWDLPVHIESLSSNFCDADLGDGNCVMSENFMYHTSSVLAENGGLGDMQMGFGVVQGRFGGLKGTWTVVKQEAWADLLGMGDDPEAAGKIPFAFADGQLKFKPSPYETSMRTLCVVKVGGIRSAPRKSPRLNAQFWTVLGSRGVGPNTCKEIVDEAVTDILDSFSDPKACFAALANTGAETAVERTLLGFFGADFRDESGVPPVNITRLTEQIRESRLRGLTQPTFHVPLAKAGKALALPDFTQTLEPLQCVYGAREVSGGPLEFIRGKVAVLQSPCHLYEDVCILEAVEPTEKMKEAFFTLDGVIVLSAHRNQQRSTADLYSGADYDGDEPVITWDKRIVSELEDLEDPWNQPPTAKDVEYEAEESLGIRRNDDSRAPGASKALASKGKGFTGGGIGETVGLVVDDDGQAYSDPKLDDGEKGGIGAALASHFLRNSGMRRTLGMLTNMHEKLAEDKPHDLRSRGGMSRRLGLLLRAAVDADKYGHSLQPPHMAGGGGAVVPWRTAARWGSATPQLLDPIRKRIMQGKGTALDAVFLRLEDVHAEQRGLVNAREEGEEKKQKMDPDLVVAGIPADVRKAGKKLLAEYLGALRRIMQRTSPIDENVAFPDGMPRGYASRNRLQTERAKASEEDARLSMERDSQIRDLLNHLRGSFYATVAELCERHKTEEHIETSPNRRTSRAAHGTEENPVDPVVLAAQLTSAIYQAWFHSRNDSSPGTQLECKLLAEAVPEHVQVLKFWKSMLRTDTEAIAAAAAGTSTKSPSAGAIALHESEQPLRNEVSSSQGGGAPSLPAKRGLGPLILSATGVAIQAEYRRTHKRQKRARLM